MVTKRKFLLGVSAVIFTLFEAVMFYLIHLSASESQFNLHYACIIAAATFSWLTLVIELITAKSENESISDIVFNAKDGNMLRIAMLFTLAADYFMVALEEADNLSGVTVFLGTQLFIFLHIFVNDNNAKGQMANLISRIMLTAIAVFAVYAIMGDEADSLAIISVIYYANLCSNAMFAHRSGRGGIILTIGLVLFALCDVNVGLSGLDSVYEGGFPEGSLPYILLNSNLDLIWFFYIPSQTLIPLTLLFCNKEK